MFIQYLTRSTSFPSPGAIPDDPREDEESEFFGTMRKRKKNQQPTQKRKAARKPKPRNDSKPVVVVNLDSDDEGNNVGSAGSDSSEVEQVEKQKTLGSFRTSSVQTSMGLCVCARLFCSSFFFDWLVVRLMLCWLEIGQNQA